MRHRLMRVGLVAETGPVAVITAREPILFQ
jgi:hypothetical protein